MPHTPTDQARRRFLLFSTAALGGVGAGFASVPFIASWQPSAKAKAAGAPVTVDISKLEPGQLLRVEWRGKPVWVVKRTPASLAALAAHNGQLRDADSAEPQQPTYAQNAYRSVRPDIFVAVGICTHLGCSPSYLPDSFGEQVKGVGAGFFCPCHGSKFDMAGRVFAGVPAPLNLVVPPHQFLADGRLLIGSDSSEAAHA
ncbi:MAG: ubiquinol-cytochrome c reductase iron-sulfur subunit [Aeromonas sp.]